MKRVDLRDLINKPDPILWPMEIGKIGISIPSHDQYGTALWRLFQIFNYRAIDTDNRVAVHQIRFDVKVLKGALCLSEQLLGWCYVYVVGQIPIAGDVFAGRHCLSCTTRR